jgi:hypothetical protein
MSLYRVEQRAYRTQYGTRIWEVEAESADDAKDNAENGKMVSETWDEMGHQDIEFDDTISVTQIGESPKGVVNLGGMLVKVVYQNKVQEVMIAKNGVTRDAIKAAGIDYRKVTSITVTGINVCGDTTLRNGDYVYVK